MPVQRGFRGTVLGRCSTVDDKEQVSVYMSGSQKNTLFSSVHGLHLSCRQFMSSQVTHTDLSPAPEVSVHFYHCERKRGRVIRPLCWPMTHCPPHPSPPSFLLPRRPQKSMSEQYLKPGGGPRRNRSLPPSQSILNAFLSCENSQVLVVLGSIMSTVESQGTSHSAGSIQIMFIGKERDRVSVGSF